MSLAFYRQIQQFPFIHKHVSRLQLTNIVRCSVTDLGDYCPFQWAYLFETLVTCTSLSQKVVGSIPRLGSFPLQHLYQSIKFLGANIPNVTSLSGTKLNQSSAAKSMKQFNNINAPSGVLVSMGNGQVKETCLGTLPEGCKRHGWMERQQGVVPKGRGAVVQGSCTCIGLDPREQQSDSFVWFQWTG